MVVLVDHENWEDPIFRARATTWNGLNASVKAAVAVWRAGNEDPHDHPIDEPIGYQIIEPDDLGGVFAIPKNFVIALAIFEWLIFEVERELGPRLEGVDLDVIRVEFVGAYPALGAHYRRPDEDVEPLLLGTIARIIRDRPLLDFVNFVTRNSTDWNTALAKLIDLRLNFYTGDQLF